jgi:hypothetical protein
MQWLQFFACTKLSAACKFAYGIHELHATLIIFSHTAGRTKVKAKKMRPRLKFSTHLGSFYSLRSIQLNHFQADLIWCDGTFQEIPITTAASKNVKVSIGGENLIKCIYILYYGSHF